MCVTTYRYLPREFQNKNLSRKSSLLQAISRIFCDRIWIPIFLPKNRCPNGYPCILQQVSNLLHKWHQSYRRNLHPLRDNIGMRHCITWKFFIFYCFCGSIPCWTGSGSEAQFIVPDWGDKVDYVTGLLYGPDRLHRLAGRYDILRRSRLYPPNKGLWILFEYRRPKINASPFESRSARLLWEDYRCRLTIFTVNYSKKDSIQPPRNLETEAIKKRPNEKIEKCNLPIRIKAAKTAPQPTTFMMRILPDPDSIICLIDWILLNKWKKNE